MFVIVLILHPHMLLPVLFLKLRLPLALWIQKKTIQESTGNITIVCSGMTGDIIYSLALTNPDKNLSMSNGKGGVLFYQLYTSANYASVWSQNKVINGLIKNINGNGSDTLPFYGRIIIRQNTSSGNYTVFTNPPLITLTY